jgi:hypothetical protein
MKKLRIIKEKGGKIIICGFQGFSLWWIARRFGSLETEQKICMIS